MSISTRTGDQGLTGLVFNRRVSKTHPRVHAYGACDELSATIGMAKAFLAQIPDVEAREIWDLLNGIQKEMVYVMGELAVATEDRKRFLEKNQRIIQDSDVDRLTQLVHRYEKSGIRFDGWATPGANPPAAALDVARTVCRRTERQVLELDSEATQFHPVIVRYLNRLSDLLWVLARKAEQIAENGG